MRECWRAKKPITHLPTRNLLSVSTKSKLNELQFMRMTTRFRWSQSMRERNWIIIFGSKKLCARHTKSSYRRKSKVISVVTYTEIDTAAVKTAAHTVNILMFYCAWNIPHANTPCVYRFFFPFAMETMNIWTFIYCTLQPQQQQWYHLVSMGVIEWRWVW